MREQENTMFAELIANVMHSTPQAFVGIGLMVVYLIGMISIITYRIKKGDHMHH